MNFASLWTDYGSSLEKVIWAIFIGTVVASFMIWYSKGFIGRVARRLAKKEAHSPDNAYTLRELGCDNIFMRNALKYKYSALRKVVYCTLDKEKLKRNDFYEAEFYIPEELKNRAYFKYKGNNNTLPVVLIGAVVMFIIAQLCIRFIPEIVEMIKKI
ncbi:MAG: hypothetical protein IKT46_08530 [Clostridia bacterium]|nr:hypothetical protein [Clostridia bacterium]